MKLSELDGTRWEGRSELWEDPLGDVVQASDCTMAIDGEVVSYRWSYQGKEQAGALTLRPDGAEFTDSWHQATPVACEPAPGRGSIATVQYRYLETWGWRINLCVREPSGELVLQMTNIAPWGEEMRAVRMVCTRAAE
jgi:hypothetical protein